MKKLSKLKRRLIGAAVAVAVAVPLVLYVISLSNLPTLSFEGMRINVLREGDIQLLVDVCVALPEATGSSTMFNGARFKLNYNTKYLEPSDYDTNKPLEQDTQGNIKPFAALHISEGLYLEDTDGDKIPDTSANPFIWSNNAASPSLPGTLEDYNYVNLSDGVIAMSLVTDGKIDPLPGSGMEKIEAGEANLRDYYNVLTMPVGQEKLAIGTLSFRVTDPDLLPELTKKFDYQDLTLDAIAKDNSGDHLLWFQGKAGSLGNGPWGIFGCYSRGTGTNRDWLYVTLDDYGSYPSSMSYRQAQAAFAFRWPRVVTSVHAAEAQLTLNAYQAYTKGDVEDLSRALQTYSPTVLVRYSDGSQESVIMPWGRVLTPWTDCVVTEERGGTTVTVDNSNYDPTGGVYKIEKLYNYETTDIDGSTIMRTFPTPVRVDMTVTPITLVAVSANDLHRSYLLNNALVSGPTAVRTVSDLALPDEARLITDIPAGGATLTMPVPGWSHGQTNGNWPSPTTDSGGNPISGTGTTMGDLWKDTASLPTTNAADIPYLHWPTDTDMNRWTEYEPAGTDETTGHQLGANRAGLYTFFMATNYGGSQTYFTRPEIKVAYPWLTVPDNTQVADHPEAWPLENATRRIVWDGELNPDEPQKKLEDENNYEVSYVQTVTAGNSQPELTLRVRKKGSGGNWIDLAENSYFRIKLPDGTEMGVGLNNVDGVTLPNWFSNTDGYYTPGERTLDERRAFDLVSNPGDPTSPSNTYNTQRELLRRYINLGGWFSVAVNEDPDNYYWSNFIPVYVPPRENFYEESKTYNFVGSNAGLFPWAGGINTTVILPPGQYETVDATGAPLYVQADASVTTNATDTRATERYGVPTTYDGTTGAQPGELNMFTVDPGWTTAADGTSVTGKLITRYGPEEFLHQALYGAFGRVSNQRDTADNAPKTNYSAAIRTEETTPRTELEKITLTYDGTGGVRYDANHENVVEVIYDTRLQGYATRQDYTLTINNVGTVDISGLSIDLLTDAPVSAGDGKGYYVILKPPASFLPAGESTTFTLTYVYGLNAPGGTKEYLDKLFITSNSRHKADGDTYYRGDENGDGANDDYLLDFDARFTVSSRNVHRVYVRTEPADGSMGTAQVIVGQMSDGTMNTNAGSNAFASGDQVYVMADPADEYEVKVVTYVDGSGARFELSNPQDVTLADGSTVKVYTFPMPDYDVTVTVTFEEPIKSKLRLSKLRVFADEERSLLKPDKSDPAEYTVWQKSFTPAETGATTGMTDRDKGRYLANKGKAVVKGYSDSVDQYLVVIPYEANYSQVEVTLRQVVNTLNGQNPNLPTGNGDRVEVFMTLFPADPINDAGTLILSDQTGNTATPTTHTSNSFDSPKPGSSSYVEVRVSYYDGTTTTDRYYYVEIHRKPKEPIATLNYGNSPFGMIMNADNIAAADKNAAKAAFVNNNYSFDGLNAAYVPDAVSRADAAAAGREEIKLSEIHYWTEAWVAPDALYEPESQTGYLYNSASGIWEPNPAIYNATNNLDLSDTAFFAIMGEEFLDPGLEGALDSTGRPADLTDATISLTAYTLNIDGTTQLERFALPDTSDTQGIADRTVTLSRDRHIGVTVSADWSVGETGTVNLRPGRYQLAYTYPDYDNTKENPSYLVKYRDFVVLAPVGDVNADRTLTMGEDNGSDEALMKERVTGPLGYLAENYPDGAIFKLRTCDVNNDRNINNIDANGIRTNRQNGVQKYYLPVDYK